jgi:DnaJ-class molecular chaperone
VNKLSFTYADIENASQTLGLIGIETRDEIKKKYLKLSKKHHPDMCEGDSELFQKINSAYKLLEEYMKRYKFSFSKKEFYEQYPYAKEYNGDLMWSKKK